MLMVTDRIARVQERIFRSCQKSGRTPDRVRLVAVTKTLEPETVNEAIAAGLHAIGENRVQEYLRKRPFLLPHEFHLIGHLQRNKTKAILPFCDWIHSVDSAALAEEIQRQAAVLGRTFRVLIEVNVSGEESKNGVDPDALPRLADAVAGLPNLSLRGLMTVAEYAEDAEAARPSFRRLRELREALQARHPGTECDQLSMGMTHDFDVAIEEGATMVRLGTAIFGQRP
jgi:PLP dependent protein